MNYHVSDFIIRIKNAYLANRKHVTMPYSKINKAIGKTLVKEGFLADIKEEEKDGKKILVATLRYVNRKPVLSDVIIVSKPSLRVYQTADELKSKRHEAMLGILSTSQGIMSSKEAAKKNIGGELLFKIW